VISELELTAVETPELAPLAPGPRPGPGLASRVGAWAWRHWVSLAVVIGLLAVVGVAHAWGMTSFPAPSDDEGTYMAQAWAVQERGALSHYTYWYDHPPLGWLLIAGWTWTTGAFERAVSAVGAGRELVLLVNLANCALLYLLGRRIGLHRLAAGAAVVLFALSPLGLTYHRMVLLDNMAVTWALAAFVLVSSPLSRLWASATGGACFAAGVLTKETTLLLLPAVVAQLWSRCDPRTRRFCLTGFASAFVLVASSYPLAALLKGELLPGEGHVSLLEAVRFQLFTRPSTGSVFDPTQPGHRVVREWLDLDPWLLGAGVALVAPALLVRNLRPVAVGLAFPALMVVRDGYLPGPFVIGLLPFAALLVTGLGSALWRRRRRLTREMRRLEALGRAPSPVVPASGSAWDQRLLIARRSAIAAAAVAAIVVVGPRWAEADHRVMTADSAAPFARATRWIGDTVPRTSRLLVDDTLWLDLVEKGFNPDLGVVWFYKLDFTTNLDPSVARRLPEGWRHFDYVVSTPVLRQSLRDMPGGLVEVRKALESSTTVARFGEGRSRVEVRRVERPLPAGPPSTAPVPAPAGAPPVAEAPRA
jgi:hypothetical protein